MNNNPNTKYNTPLLIQESFYFNQSGFFSNWRFVTNGQNLELTNNRFMCGLSCDNFGQSCGSRLSYHKTTLQNSKILN